MFATQQPFNPEYTQNGEKRIRTKVACDYCKKRKSKCDGENPCSKCVDKDRQCVYTIVQKQRKKRETKGSNNLSSNDNLGVGAGIKPVKVTKKDKTVNQLNSRINVLENLISKIVSNMDPSARSVILDQIPGEELSELNSSTSDDDSLSDEIEEPKRRKNLEFKDADLESDLFGEDVKDVAKDPVIMKDMLAPSDKTCFSTRMKNRIAQYCGTHSMFYTLSSKALDWLKKKITGSDTNFLTNDIYSPLRKMPMLLNNIVERSKNQLIEKSAIENDNLKFLQHHERNIIFEAIDLYYYKFGSASFVCSPSTLRELFHKYFQLSDSDEITFNSNITKSDCLIMSSSLVLSFARFTSNDEIDPLLYPNLSLMTTKEAERFREKFFDLTMQNYKHVSVKNEGIKSVQGLALLSLIVEESFVSDFQINYGIISTMITYAKECGIHRADCLNDDDQEYALTCRRVWSFCECMGVEISYKSGKPMIINYDDVTTLTDADTSILSIPLDLFANRRYTTHVKETVEKIKQIGPHYYAGYFNLMLARIKAKSYTKLYSKLPSGIGIQGILTVVNEINDDMKKMAQIITPELRPSLDDELAPTNCFPCDDRVTIICALEFHFSYFSHLLAVNRVPFVKDFKIEDERLLPYGNTSLRAARKILELSVDPKTLSVVEESSFPFLVFYPMAAFLNLLGNCLIYPNASSSYQDSLLLIQVSRRFFAYEGTKNINLDNKRMFCDLLSRVFIRILVDVMQKQSGVDFYEIVPELKDHLDSVHAKFPEFFKNPTNDFTELDKLINETYSNASTAGSTASYSSLGSDVKPIISSFINNYGSDNFSSYDFQDYNVNQGIVSGSKHSDPFGTFENFIQQEQQLNDMNFNFNFNNFKDLNDFTNYLNFPGENNIS